MREKVSNSFIKQFVATMFAVAFILIGVCIGSDDAKQVYAAEVTTTTHASGKFVYATYTDKEEVKNCLGKVAPGTKDGYLFAGWYTDVNCTEAIKDSTQVDEADTFYAKYVPENVLSTKVQISLNDINTTDEYDTRNMRFVSSVDDLTYGQVGFALKYQEKGSTTWRTFKNEGTYVFSRIVAAAGNDEYKFSPKVVDTKSEYFITATWKGPDVEPTGLTDNQSATTDFNTGYYVRAYWVTMDGVTVYGPTRYVSVNDGLQTNIINVAVKGATTESGTVEVSGYEGATGKVAYYDGTYSHVRIDLGEGKDRSAVLKSVTRFTVDGVNVYYRNTMTKYAGTGTEDTSWYSVYGPNAGEYVIATSADLYGLPTLTNEGTYKFENQTVYVIANIEVNKGTATPTGWNGEGGTAYPWTPIIEFYGAFDGQGHTISGIQVQSNAAYCGFFGYTNRGKNSEIKNFRLENSFFGQSSGNGLGSIVGWGEGGTIQNVYSNAYVYKTGGIYSGGIVGLNYYSPMTIKNCCYEGLLTTTISGAGGILGDSYSSTADIIDCKFSGSIKTSKEQSGGITGINRTTLTITGCESSGSIVTSDTQSGGLVGTNSSSLTITDCLFDGEITFNGTSSGLKAIGGLVGKNYGSTFNITTSLNSGTLTNDTELTITGVCRLVGMNENANMQLNKVYFTNEGFNGTSSYYSTVDLTGPSTGIEVARTDVTGNLAFFNTALFKDNDSWALVLDDETTEVDESSTPVLKAFADKVPNEPEIPDYADVDWYIGVYNKQFTICNNDDNDANVKELYGLAYLVNEQGITFNSCTVTMQNDVTVNAGTVEAWEEQEFANLTEWAPLGVGSTAFAGTFDGGNHTISGIYINSSEQGAGLFRSTAEGSAIKNLRLTESYITSNSTQVGSIVGSCGGNITNVSSSARITGTAQYVGGLAGQISSTNDIMIQNCSYEGELDAYRYAGGLVGSMQSGSVTINGSYFAGKLNATSHHAGGILGHSFSDGTTNISKCYSTGTVKSTGGNNIGGILGYLEKGTVNMENCLNTGTVKAGDAGAGGLLGRTWTGIVCNMTNCLNRGEVQGVSRVGSAIGWHSGGKVTPTSVYATKTSTATGSDATVSINDVAVGSNKDLAYAQMVDLTDITVSATTDITSDSVITKLEGFDFGTIWTIGTEEGSMPELQLN